MIKRRESKLAFPLFSSELVEKLLLNKTFTNMWWPRIKKYKDTSLAFVLV